MPRRPARLAPKPIGTPLPSDWRRTSNWRVWAMLARIPDSEYETQARAFEAHNVGRLSDDWTRDWKTWCRMVLVNRVAVPVSISGGMFD